MTLAGVLTEQLFDFTPGIGELLPQVEHVNFRVLARGECIPFAEGSSIGGDHSCCYILTLVPQQVLQNEQL